MRKREKTRPDSCRIHTDAEWKEISDLAKVWGFYHDEDSDYWLLDDELKINRMFGQFPRGPVKI